MRNAPPARVTTFTLPGKFEAEDYRSGGEGVGYHDTTGGNFCGNYRSDDVDTSICDSDGDTACHYVGWIRQGEWLAYDVAFPNEGAYRITIRTATIRDNRSFYIELDETRIGGSIRVPNTGDWHAWTEVVSDSFEIPAGNYSLKIIAETGQFNMNDIEITSSPAVFNERLVFGLRSHGSSEGWR